MTNRATADSGWRSAGVNRPPQRRVPFIRWSRACSRRARCTTSRKDTRSICRSAAKFTRSCMKTNRFGRRCRRSWAAKCDPRPSRFKDSFYGGGKRMKEFNLGSVLVAAVLAVGSAAAQNAPEISLARFDCGKTTTLNDVSRFSDVAAFKGLNIELTFSCYLVKHGNDYLIWDTGNPSASGGTPAPTAPKASLVEQLAQLHMKPEQITFVGISHYHGDHAGQLASFPGATLLIGKGDWDFVNQAG